MVSPINYGAFFQGQASPNQAFQQAFQQAAGVRQVMAEREAAEAQAQALADQKRIEQEAQAELLGLFDNPEVTARDYQRFALKYPAFQERVKAPLQSMTEAEQKATLQTLSRVAPAFAAGKPEIVLEVLREQAEGYRNAGDAKGAKILDDVIRATEINPAVGKSTAYMLLNAIPGGDKIIEGMSKIGQETRAQELQPIAVRRQTAEAAGAEAESTTKAVTAKFAESNALQEIEQRGWNIKNLQADIDYKKAQSRIAAMNAAIAREGNDLKRQELRMKMDDAIRERESKLREKIGAAESGAANIDNMLNTIERIKLNPAVDDVVGSLEGRMPEFASLLDDKESDAIALINTLGSQAFLSQVAQIKGMGALSNAEGEKLQAAFQNLGRAQSEKQFRTNLDEASRLLKKGRENLFKSSGLPVPKPDTPAAPGSRPPLSSFEKAQ